MLFSFLFAYTVVSKALRSLHVFAPHSLRYCHSLLLTSSPTGRVRKRPFFKRKSRFRRLRTAGREGAFGGVAPRPHDLFEKRSIKNFWRFLHGKVIFKKIMVKSIINTYQFCLLFSFLFAYFLFFKRKSRFRRLRTTGPEVAFGGVAPRPHDLFEKRSIKNFRSFLHGKKKVFSPQKQW